MHALRTTVPHVDANLICVLLIGNLLHDIAIEALTGTQVSTCATIGRTALADGETRQIQCQKGTFGSVIKITRNASDENNLVLCEVEVHGTPGKISLLNITSFY